MEDRVLTERESLELISQMIRNTREKVEKNAGAPFLIWGYTTVIISLVVWYLFSTTHNPAWHWLWFGIPVIGLPLFLLQVRAQEKQPKVKTYVDRIITYIWAVMGTTSFVVAVFAMFYRTPVLFIMLLMMGMATTLTGLVIRFTPIIISGILGVGCSFICFFITGTDQILLFALVFLLMMVIPGHVLNYSAKVHSKK